jgi:hypothetical protein
MPTLVNLSDFLVATLGSNAVRLAVLVQTSCKHHARIPHHQMHSTPTEVLFGSTTYHAVTPRDTPLYGFDSR